MERDENSFERQKDADESISKDILYSGQAGGDIGLGKKKVKYNKDKNATNDVGCDYKR